MPWQIPDYWTATEPVPPVPVDRRWALAGQSGVSLAALAVDTVTFKIMRLIDTVFLLDQPFVAVLRRLDLLLQVVDSKLDLALVGKMSGQAYEIKKSTMITTPANRLGNQISQNSFSDNLRFNTVATFIEAHTQE